MTRHLSVPHRLLAATLRELRDAGAASMERLVLWTGEPAADAHVSSLVVPPQEADVDYFHVPPIGMRAVFDALRPNRHAVLAQVHSHPGVAFHSEADDEWAIVRYEGALSIVVPYFASATTPETFVQDAAVFVLRADDVWHEVPRGELDHLLEMTP
jgi:proteasome lid subunit RPN8/RPN11